MDFVETCRRFIAIDSTPSCGSREIASVAAALCRDRGLDVELQDEVHDGLDQANLIARPRGVGRPAAEFMLQNHLDTADPGPFQMWAQNGQNPFDATIIDGKIHGLGTASTKLDFLCKLEAMASFAGRSSWTLPPVLVGTYGEETGMTGALKLIRKNKISAKMALIGEPTDLRLVSAAKGFANVEIRLPFSEEENRYRREHDLRESTSTQSRIFRGKAVHSSVPHLGDSAIVKMLDSLTQLPDGVVVMEIDGGLSTTTVPAHAFLEIEVANVRDPIAPKIRRIHEAVRELEREFQAYKDPDFLPDTPTLNIGLIRTEEEHVQFSGSCRLPPLITQETYEKWMENLRRVCADLGGYFRVTDYKKPFRTPAQSILVKGCLDELRALGLPDRVTTQASTNEASLFSRTGVDCACFGPGSRENNIHTPDEHVRLEDLHRATEFYRRVIERFCL
ncbi:MAG: M20/M25/M40 family metallo-hydrolase [Bdellovibrionaceae bacterium]|nr:M20/M25/M40 family metallo-hydrolase [Pseudobdellovibrionaceae bacterium]MBX3034131.1 M20/M25/M40 family metallo-hydrolase [Pseudobdellovibrionaceae bacterium]